MTGFDSKRQATADKLNDDDAQGYIAQFDDALQKEYQRGYDAGKASQPEQEPVAWISENAGLYHGKPDESLNPLPLYLAPPPCPTCEALARTVMLDQTSYDNFKPDWDTEAVLVEEQQRMAKRIEDLEAMLEHQIARIVDLQTHIENLEGENT